MNTATALQSTFQPARLLLSGNEALAYAAYHSGVQLGTGYPGTPSTEMLENFAKLGGHAQWAPNEKVAFEVALGAAIARGRTVVTMKHVGLNVAADPLFTAAYTGVAAGFVVFVADDFGMASSQNEQDTRYYAKAAGLPLLDPSDSQDAYDFFAKAIEISERWHLPIILRTTTRVSHSKSTVTLHELQPPQQPPHFVRDIPTYVMIPAYARPAHARLLKKLDEIQEWNDSSISSLQQVIPGDSSLGIIASGIAYIHAREAAPHASFLKIGMPFPLPLETIRKFVASVERCVVIEEGDPILAEAIWAEGIQVESKPPLYRLGELNVQKVRKILNYDISPDAAVPRGKPPELCPACPHRTVFSAFQSLNLIITGDIGCYTLGVLEPFGEMDTCVCMGASIGMGLGMRHVLPEDQARRVLSVIGDGTFMHSGLTGLLEMVYNPPPTGHIVLILDNGTTAMTGLQEHPGTGRTLDMHATGQVRIEDVARGIGVQNVIVFDPDPKDGEAKLIELVKEYLVKNDTTVIIVRRPCILSAKKEKEYKKVIPITEARGGCHGCG